jgi:L-iditol 2-dehydrogenase
MKAAVMERIGEISIKEVGMPAPKEKEVLVRVKHVGICGSDIHYYEHGRIGDFIVTKPIILGHESAGEVVCAGNGVTGFQAGDRVCLEPGVPCGVCEYCRSGRYNLCPEVAFMATPPYDGAFAEYIAYPEHMTFKLPEGVGTMEGALIEPLAVGFHAAAQAGAKIGQSAAILGSGCIGLVTLLALRTMGIREIYMSDLIPKRLEKAGELGAAEAFRADEQDVVREIMQRTKGKGVDMVFETAGSRAATQQTAELVKRGGTVTLVGMAPDAVIPYDFGRLLSKEACIRTVFRYRNLYAPAIKAVAAGLIPLEKIVTDRFRFDETDRAMKYSVENKREIVKAVIEF